MANNDAKDLVRRRRSEMINGLSLRSLYQRAHTPTGVWRRKNSPDEKMPKQSTVSARSLENLARHRTCRP